MTVEFIGMIHHREASEIMPPSVVMDRGYIRDFAQAAEGFIAERTGQVLKKANSAHAQGLRRHLNP